MADELIRTKGLDFKIDQQQLKPDLEVYHIVLPIPPRENNQQFTPAPELLTIINLIERLGFDESKLQYTQLSEFKVKNLSQPWKTILTIINRCTTRKDTSIDKARQPMLHKHENKKVELITYPHYTKLVISHFLSKHNNIVKRINVLQHSPQHDDVVKRMKTVTKGTIVYGMRIPEELLSVDVKASMAFKRYDKEIRKLDVSMTQQKPAESTQETNREIRTSVIRISGKQEARKGKVSSDSGSATKKSVKINKIVSINKELTVDGLADQRLAEKLSTDEARQRT
ncbi:hypothetical protein Tco_0807384 [Tanacetum coccineum]